MLAVLTPARHGDRVPRWPRGKQRLPCPRCLPDWGTCLSLHGSVPWPRPQARSEHGASPHHSQRPWAWGARVPRHRPGG